MLFPALVQELYESLLVLALYFGSGYHESGRLLQLGGRALVWRVEIAL